MAREKGRTLADLLRQSAPDMLEALQKLAKPIRPQTVAAPSRSPPTPAGEFDFGERPAPPPSPEGAAAIARLKNSKKASGEKVRLNAAGRRAYEEHLAAEAASRTGAPAPEIVSPIDADVAARMMRTIRQAPKTIFETRPTSVSPKSRADLLMRLERGSRFAANGKWYDKDGPVIGLDFGTSSVKTILRWPFRPDEPAYAVAVPAELRSNGLGSLWQSVVWLGSDGTYSLIPRNGAIAIDGFKAAIISGDGSTRCAADATFIEAATAFLALQLAQIVGFALAHERPIQSKGFSAFHMGVPVASLDEGPRLDVFRRIAVAAMSLAPFALSMDRETVAAALVHPNPAVCDLEPLLVAELQAAVAGYARSRSRHLGPHIIIDCGAATLDIATFNLVDDDGHPQTSVFETAVETLGSEAYRWAIDGGASHADFLSACHQHEKRVFTPTAQRRYQLGFGASGGKRNVQVLTVGGGMRGEVHKEFVGRFEAFYGRPLVTPAASDAVECELGSDLGRLLLADGLAHDAATLPQLRAPSQISDIAQNRVHYSERYIEN